jgi:hypothetical protein
MKEEDMTPETAKVLLEQIDEERVWQSRASHLWKVRKTRG